MQIHPMPIDECFEILARTRFGRLACVKDNQPYVVPIYFAYESSAEGVPYLYGFTPPGQKVEWMRANPQVCVEWDEVKGYNQWVSVVAFGHYEELADSQELAKKRLLAHQLLKEQVVWWEPGYAAYLAHYASDQLQTYRPLYYRICIGRITGYRATPA